jgi:PAS domain S-box-containing protein
MDTLRLFEAAIGRTAALLFVLRPDGTLLFFNRACADLTGFEPNEVVGRPFWDVLVPPESRADAERRLRSLAPHETSEHLSDCLTRSGERVGVRWRYATTLGALDQIEYLIGTGVPAHDLRAPAPTDRSRHRRALVSALLLASVEGLADDELAALEETLLRSTAGTAAADLPRPTIHHLPRPVPSAPLAARAPAQHPAAEGGSVLIVEDEQRTAPLVQRMLSSAGYTAAVALDTDHVFQHLLDPDQHFDAVLIDARLPQSDGPTLVRTLKNRMPNHPPVVVVSGPEHDEARQEMIEAGAEVCITKPVYRDELFEALRRVLVRPPAPTARIGKLAS